MNIEKEIEIVNKIIASASNNAIHTDLQLLDNIISWIKFKKISHLYTVKKIFDKYGYPVYKIVKKNED